MTVNTSAQSTRWIGLLGFTIALQIVIMLVTGFIARHVVFSDWPILWLVALFCLPTIWAAFSLWRFRGIAERRAGYFAMIASLYWLWAAAEVLLG